VRIELLFPLFAKPEPDGAARRPDVLEQSPGYRAERASLLTERF
jgi:hypothetical protein